MDRIKRTMLMAAPLVALAACSGTASTSNGNSNSPLSNPSATGPAPTSDPAFAAACSKLVPDLHSLGSEVGNLVKSPQAFTSATTNISHVLTTDVAAVTDPAFKATTGSFATHLTNVGTALQGGHLPHLTDITSIASGAQNIINECSAHGSTPTP